MTRFLTKTYDMEKNKLDGKQLQILNVDYTEYSTLYTKKYENRKPWIAPDDQLVKTYIPGTVISLNVSEGSPVKKGDILMTFEAMKMNNLVHAPHAGKVVELSVKEGDKLPKGVTMMKIVP